MAKPSLADRITSLVGEWDGTYTSRAALQRRFDLGLEQRLERVAAGDQLAQRAPLVRRRRAKAVNLDALRNHGLEMVMLQHCLGMRNQHRLQHVE
jgi:hypothetical protein